MDAVQSIKLGQIIGKHRLELSACVESRRNELTTVSGEEEPMSERRLQRKQGRQIWGLDMEGMSVSGDGREREAKEPIEPTHAMPTHKSLIKSQQPSEFPE